MREGFGSDRRRNKAERGERGCQAWVIIKCSYGYFRFDAQVNFGIRYMGLHVLNEPDHVLSISCFVALGTALDLFDNEVCYG